MTVYVDDMFRHPFGRYRSMKMSHMLADDLDELHAMAEKIGVARRHFQGDHYDVCMAKRSLAIVFGAVPVTLKQLAAMAYRRKRVGWLGDPATAVADMLATLDAGRDVA